MGEMCLDFLKHNGSEGNERGIDELLDMMFR